MMVLLPGDERGRELHSEAVAAEAKALGAIREIVHLQDGGIASLPGGLDDTLGWMAKSAHASVGASELLMSYAAALRALAAHWGALTIADE